MKKIVFICALLGVEFCSAQSVMTLHDCVEYALSHSTKMKIQTTERSNEQIQRREAILNAFTPSINAEAYVNNNYGRTIDPETNTYVNTTSLNNSYSLSVGIMLFDGFSAVNNIKICKTKSLMGASVEQQTRDMLCLAIMEAYCNVVYYKELKEIVAEQINYAKENLTLVKQQFELGQKSQSDVVLVEANIAENQYSYTNINNLYESALLDLKDLMFYPMSQELEISEDMDFDVVDIDIDRKASDIADYATKNNPSVIIAKGNMQNAKVALNSAKWRFAPRLSLNGGWGTNYYSYPNNNSIVTPSYSYQISNNMGEYVQLTLQIPIYNKLSLYSNLKHKKNEYIKAEAEYDQKIKEIETEVYRAVNDMNKAEAMVWQTCKLAEVDSVANCLNTKKFEQGLISVIEWQITYNKYYESLLTKLNAQLQYYIKCAVVRYYNGESYIN